MPEQNVPYFQKFEGADGHWYWRLRATNNRTIAQGEGYVSEANVDRAVEMLREFGRVLNQARVQTVNIRKAAAVTQNVILDGRGLTFLASRVVGNKTSKKKAAAKKK